jgi:hypothetical protein
MFRKPLEIFSATGRLVRGVWTVTETISKTIVAGVQPLTGFELQTLQQEGRVTVGSVKIYTNDVLNIGERGTDKKGDFFYWNDKKYEIVARLPYQNNIINSEKYIAEYRDE